MPKMNLVSLNECAKIFGLSLKSVQTYIDEEGAPYISRGSQGKAAKIDTVVFWQWLHARARGSEASPLAEAKLAKTKEEVRKLVLENELADMVSCPVEHVVALLSGILNIYDIHINRLPEILAGSDTALKKSWTKEIEQATGSATKDARSYLKECVAASSKKTMLSDKSYY